MVKCDIKYRIKFLLDQDRIVYFSKVNKTSITRDINKAWSVKDKDKAINKRLELLVNKTDLVQSVEIEEFECHKFNKKLQRCTCGSNLFTVISVLTEETYYKLKGGKLQFERVLDPLPQYGNHVVQCRNCDTILKINIDEYI